MASMREDLRAVKDATTERLAGDIDELKASFGKLRSDVMGLVNDTMGAGKSGVNVVRDRAATAVHDVRGQLHDWQDRGAESVEALGEKIGEHPMTAALIALGVGFLVAKFFSRK